MLVSLRWLREHLNFEISLDQILQDLTDIGLEIEGTIDLGHRSGKILVGEVKSVERHPNADKLTLCSVDVGKPAPLSIVCGASNHREGDRVPVALIGAELPNGMRLKPVEIRGVPSQGMMCSGKELHWSDDASGILILPPEWQVGEPVDFLIDVSVTANRPDCMSIHGIARDLAAKHKRKTHLAAARIQEQLEHVEQMLHVSVKERSKCSRYCARLIQGVRVGPSPLWMIRALESVGLRSVNNVVDVTNYVLMELGHPLHAFDAEMIADRQITVRAAKEGEAFETLDGTKLTLTEDDLVIADGKRAVALAGVMGGLNSEVTESTTTVALEAAHFDPVTIRRTSKRHGIVTDSSQRFERGTDRAMLPHAINRATQLIKEICGGEVARGTIDVQSSITEISSPIALRLSRVQQLLGLNLPHTEIADLLVHLGCEIVRADREQFFVTAPSWRVDLTREIDLIEEIARIRGYDQIPVSLPAVVGQPRALPPQSEATGPLTDTLVAEGFHEVLNFGFTCPEFLASLGLAENLVMIRNPLTRDFAAMRPSVLPSVLSNVAHNLNRGASDVRLFEIGTAHAKDDGGTPREWTELCAVLCGSTPATWSSPARAHGFHTIKGVAERCLQALGIAQCQVRPLEDPRFHPKRAAVLCQGPQVLARIGELHPDFLATLEIERRVCALEMQIEPLVERARARRVKCREVSRHPSVDRDIAVVVDRSTQAGDLLDSITRSGGDLLESARLFDLYEGEGVPEGKRSLAYALVFRAPDRTLREEEVQRVIDSILSTLAEKHGAELRQ
ncbi:phenylalanine--tRNA ligase subunit beta [Candidatus Sumerlaeota bacterium]|nr:phenylalanine--tRNA ligase subunit beta [Candidatus Sumerlaeota bacterium]